MIIKATGLQAKITAEKLESGIFSKSDTKEKYMVNVEKVLTHMRKKIGRCDVKLIKYIISYNLINYFSSDKRKY